jgi:hypothetical protein
MQPRKASLSSMLLKLRLRLVLRQDAFDRLEFDDDGLLNDDVDMVSAGQPAGWIGILHGRYVLPGGLPKRYSAVGNIGDTHGCDIVIPAEAGTQAAWVPAFAGMTEIRKCFVTLIPDC